MDRDPDNVAAAHEEELLAVQGDATQEAVLRKTGVERARALVATTSSDKANLLIRRLARTPFGVNNVVARVNSEASLATFTEAGVRAMSPLSASVMVLDNLLRRPSTLKLLTDLNAGKEVREVQLRNGSLAGKALKADDLLTLIGTSGDVAEAASLYEGAKPGRPVAPAGLPQERHP